MLLTKFGGQCLQIVTVKYHFKFLLFDISYVNRFGEVEQKADVYSGNLLYFIFAALDLQKSRQTCVYKKRELSSHLSSSQATHHPETFHNNDNLYGISFSQNFFCYTTQSINTVVLFQ